ncbi:hypothetical protein DYB31_002451 [Aphanomyces astaci]|uniref:GTP-binding protein LepA C-terminal domain-containing protein n=1 Tax=Aphanomyces astaci TaxID=112090 RepID=A0A397FZM7_APHAT|nr:hypothetical protein DYB31_002451 [Aphanomyces astaci]
MDDNGTTTSKDVVKALCLLKDVKQSTRETFLDAEVYRRRVAEQKDLVEAHHLKLQNLLYEKDNLLREIKRCRGFPTKELDKIEFKDGVLPVLVDDDRHKRHLQRLDDELSDRKAYTTLNYFEASLNYREVEPQQSDIVKVDILINGKILDALSFVCHRSKATAAGRALCLKLKNVIDRQQYEISIQATLGAKVFAKERIAPFRKDVLIKSGKAVGGGDITRKQKLLKKQKEGKKRMKTVGNVQLSQNAFWSVMSK